jgi:hypothetical protein
VIVFDRLILLAEESVVEDSVHPAFSQLMLVQHLLST